MAIEWDVLETFSRIHRHIGDNWFHIYGSQSANMDFFGDELHENDAIIFVMNAYAYPNGYKKSHAHSFSSIKVNVAEPVDGDYDYVWEYFTWNDTWEPLPNVNDPSNGLRNAGTHEITWDMPTNWGMTYGDHTGSDWIGYGFSVRLRIYNVNGGTGGGKQGDEEIQGRNYAITIRDGNEYTIADIFDSGLGNITKHGDKFYFMLNNLALHNGTLKMESGDYLQIGTMDTPYMITMWEDGVLDMENAEIRWNPYYYGAPYNYFYGTLRMRKASKFSKSRGGYYTMTFGCNLELSDSQIYSTSTSTDGLLLTGYTTGYIRRTNIGFTTLLLYTPYVELDNAALITIEHQPHNNILMGTSSKYAIFKNAQITDKMFMYASQGGYLILLDCLDVDRSRFYVDGNNYNTYPNMIEEAYTLKLKVVDEQGNPIEGAKVEVYDKNGHTALFRDWFQTDDYRITDLSTPDDTTGVFYPDTPPWAYEGMIVRLRQEYVKFTEINGRYVTVERHQSYKGYDSLTRGSPGYHSPIFEELDYITTDADGEIKFTGANGEFYPRINVYVKAYDYDQTTVEREFGPTFKIRVSKPGYETFENTIDITEPTNILVVLRKSQKTALLNFKDLIYHIGADSRKPLWIKI